MRVFLNEILVASQAAGNGGSLNAPPHEPASMVVKEFYDDTGATLVGRAAMLKTVAGTDSDSWTYYCVGPEARCPVGRDPTEQDPAYGQGRNMFQCSGCHGNMVFTQAP